MYLRKILCALLIVMSCTLMQACSYLGIGHLDSDYLFNKYTDQNSRFMEVENIPIHYKVQGQGEPIILIHGFMASLHTWDKWTEELSKHYTVYRMDLPGFGLSGNLSTEHDYTVEDYMIMMEAFMDFNKIQSAHVVGNSLGGYIAWKYAIRDPQRVKTVTLIDGVSHAMDTPWPIDLVANPLTSPGAYLFAPKLLFSTALKQVYGDDSRLRPETIDSYHEMAMRKGNKKNLVISCKVFKKESKNPQLGEDFKKLSMPTLLMWGKKDEWIPVKYAYRLKRELPSAQLLVYPDVGHIAMEEVPMRSVKDFMTFIQGGQVANISAVK